MRTARVHRLLVIVLAAWAARSAMGAPASSVPDFTREVRPLLSRHCLKCHGPDEATRKARLRLDARDSATHPAKSGAVAVVAGKPEQSELIKRIDSTDPDEVMPPPSTKIVMTAAEKDLLRRWIAGGAEYREHWAFVPPVQAPLPAVKDSRWCRNAIDRFVLEKIEAAGLHPSPEAGPATLARRLYLDLIGLPPTPEEADAFLADKAPGAYERLVDRLLASPRYGERWARRWLDLARYADTNGYEKDRERSIWPWRDWVIRALNADMPFDRFTIEQIAGDLLPGATLEQRVATGFHRNTMLNEEGGIDPLEFRFHAMTDRVNTTGTAWLGLTLRCVQCHAHKYDPIPHREYYQVMAMLNNADEPELDLPDAAAESRRRENLEKADRLVHTLASRYPVDARPWEIAAPVEVTTASGETPKTLPDGSVLFAPEGPDKETVTLVLETTQSRVEALRLDALVHDSLPSHGPGRVPHGNFVLTEIRVTAAPRAHPTEASPVKLASATADVEQAEFPVSRAFDGNPSTGWAVDVGKERLNKDHQALFNFDKPVEHAGGIRLVVTLAQDYGGKHTLGRVRLGLGLPTPADETVEARRRKAVDKVFAAWLARERGAVAPWRSLHPTEAKSNSPLLTVLPDESILGSGDITKSDTYDLRFAPAGGEITAVRLEVLPDDSLPAHGPGMTYYEGPRGDFFMGEFQLFEGDRQVRFAKATESYARNNFGSSASAQLATDGDPQTGWSTAGREGERHEAVFVPAEPLTGAGPLRIRMLFGRHYACSLGRFRVSVTSHPGGAAARDLPLEIQQLLLLPEESLSAAQRDTLLEACLLRQPELADARREIEQLRRPPALPRTLVLRERPVSNPRPTFIHKRGEFLQPTDPVDPGVLLGIAPFPPEFPRNRLGLARWLVWTNNPLTARVTVNRQWQAFFGNGLVRTVEDFGFQGEAPTHPALLDWLAVQFMNEGWSMKRLHRLMVTSATYRQDSKTTPELLARDAENRLLARGARLRLEAEIIRDSALQAGGLLSLKMGGPSVYPPQPPGVTDIAYGGAQWNPSAGEDRYRRSVYTFSKRTAPFALYNTFDAPAGDSCVARRDMSNTPLQALSLLNDPVFMDVAQALGGRLAESKASVDDRVRDLFRRTLARTPTPAEVATLSRFYERQLDRFRKGELDPAPLAGPKASNAPERAAWSVTVRALLNLDEAVTKS